MKTSKLLRNFLALLLLPLLMNSATAQNNEILDYITEIKVDQYNKSAVPGEEPKRGGEFRIRTPSDFGNLNPLLVRAQADQELLRLINDDLITQDPQTQEIVPYLAITFSKGDLIKLKPTEENPETEILSGTFTKMGDPADPNSEAVFVPDAYRKTYYEYEVETYNIEEGSLTLKEHVGGETLKGKITKNFFTLEVNEAHDPARKDSIITTTIAGLDTWKVGDEVRPFQKQECYFTFTLRDGITWHDGKKMTGEDVLFSFETLKNTAVDAQRIRNYYSDVNTWQLLDDGMTMEFMSDRPYFQQFLFLGAISLMPKHIFEPENFGGDDKAFGEAFNEHPFRNNPVGCGPYKFVEWNKDDSLSVTRYNNYWASKLPEGAVFNWKPEQPYFDSIKYIVIPDKGVALKELQRGAIDADLDVEPDTFQSDQTKTEEFTSEFVRARGFGFLYTYISMKNDDPILQDKAVRQALALLIPREKIIEDIYNDLAIPVSGPFYLYGPGYNEDVELIPYDTRRATRLLRRAGWLDRDRDGVVEKEINGEIVPLELEYMIHTARDYHAKVADIIKESVESVGIKLTIRKLDFNSVLEKTLDRDFQMARIAWGTSLDPDPYQIWHSSQIGNRASNYAGFSNPEADRLMEQLRETFDAPKRWEIARELHRIIAEDQPVIFLEGFQETYFYDKDIRNVRYYPSQYPHNYREWWWADPQERTGAGS